MSGGEALDLALGLLRAPARRALLIARPLPSGMTTLLEVAGGSAGAAQAAAASTGATPEELLEASRFFVQQVLLDEDSDAYRMMGVDRDADGGRIRDHHRLLLRWLHPDRTQGDQWESVLATRVNQAWNRIRTPAARTAYESRMPQPAGQPHPFPGHAALVPQPPAVPCVPLEPASVRRPGPAALGMAALTVACVGLGWLALQGGPEPDTPEFARVTSSASAPVPVSAPELESALEHDPGAAAILAPLAAIAAETAPTPDSVATREPEVAVAPELHARPPVLLPLEPERVASPPPPPIPAPPMTTTTPVTTGVAVTEPFPLPLPQPLPAPVTADAPDPLQLFESANAAVGVLTGWLASGEGAEQPAYSGPPARLEAVDARLRLHHRLGQGRAGRLSLEQADWRLDAQQASVDARYRLTSRGRERETGSAHIQLARRDSQWQLASLNLVADP